MLRHLWGVLVGAAIAGYDYVVNTLLWDSFSSHLNPFVSIAAPYYRDGFDRRNSSPIFRVSSLVDG